MSKQVQEAYIVAATRTPVGKAPRGMFRDTRPDDLLVHALKSVLAQAPSLDPGELRTFELKYEDPVGRRQMGAISVVTPVAYTDFAATDDEANEGSDQIGRAHV